MKKTTSYSKITKGLLVLTLFIFISSLNSCDKDEPTPDPCESVTCLNGGTCDNGNCDCPDGYSGTNCETYDACYNVTCLNGGVCINGDCDCADGYSGPSCADQITPSRIRISKIDVTRFPATETGGGGWDLTSGPDIYVVLFKGDVNVWTSPIYYENASQTSYSFEINPPYDISSPNDQYTIRLYDWDSSDADDYMGGIIFYPYNSNNGFPSVLDIDASGNVAFDFFVSYVW